MDRERNEQEKREKKSQQNLNARKIAEANKPVRASNERFEGEKNS